jgi:thiosulfate/3-mercaptopyruvate sulfurtransferase
MTETFKDDPKTLVSTEWLAAHLKDADLRIFDASWFLPTVDRDPKAEFDKEHIPGARFFDIDEIADLRSDLPHMVPPVEKFMSRVRAMGVGDGHQIVVYDSSGLFSAARVWWMFRLFGQFNIAVLDGGLPKWKAEGRPLTDAPATIRDRHMMIDVQHHMIKDVTQVARASKLRKCSKPLASIYPNPPLPLVVRASRPLCCASLSNAQAKPTIHFTMAHGPNGACTPTFLSQPETHDAGASHRTTRR